MIPDESRPYRSVRVFAGVPRWPINPAPTGSMVPELRGTADLPRPQWTFGLPRGILRAHPGVVQELSDAQYTLDIHQRRADGLCAHGCGLICSAYETALAVFLLYGALPRRRAEDAPVRVGRWAAGPPSAPRPDQC